MGTTLHVDLLWTDLEDFIEHFEEQLNGANAMVLFGDRTDAVFWESIFDRYGPEADDMERAGIENYTRIIATSTGTTSKNYWIWTRTLNEPEDPKATITVTRYRRDRLKLVVYDFFRIWICRAFAYLAATKMGQ